MDVSIIVPTLNEADNVPHIVERIRDVMDSRAESYEIIVVDGFSDDATVDRARDAGCQVVQEPGGKGDAIRRGIAEADGDILITMDADLSHRATELGLLIEGIRAGYDVCLGSRFIQGGGTNDMPIHRYLGNRVFVLLVNLFWNTDFSDLCYGYRSFRADAFDEMDVDATGFDIETELSIRAAKNGLRMLEVPSFEKERRAGDAKLRTFSDGLRILRTILHEALTR